MEHKYSTAIRSIIEFGLASLVALMLDVGIYYMLIKMGVRIFFSSMLSGFVAVTFAFIVSGLWVFKKNKVSFRGYIAWLCYQALNILFFSSIINWLWLCGMDPIWSKLSVIPVTFLLNYIVVNQLIRNY